MQKALNILTLVLYLSRANTIMLIVLVKYIG